MARFKNNVVIHGLSGKIDMLIFRQLNGKTVVSKVSEKKIKRSKLQKQHNKRFKRASIYAKLATADPDTKYLYVEEAKKRKGMTAYGVAVADFFNAPDINTIDLSQYTGIAGDEIQIIASDDFAVKSVHVQIDTADGTSIEKGEAVNITKNIWKYIASTNNESLNGCKIIVTAYDIPGNATIKEKSI
jgi:hypothetical protein